jgi:hypothetical protein
MTFQPPPIVLETPHSPSADTGIGDTQLTDLSPVNNILSTNREGGDEQGQGMVLDDDSQLDPRILQESVVGVRLVPPDRRDLAPAFESQIPDPGSRHILEPPVASTPSTPLLPSTKSPLRAGGGNGIGNDNNAANSNNSSNFGTPALTYDSFWSGFRGSTTPTASITHTSTAHPTPISGRTRTGGSGAGSLVSTSGSLPGSTSDKGMGVSLGLSLGSGSC